MANFVITSSSNAFRVEIDGKFAVFTTGDVHPYTPDGTGNVVYLYEIKGVLKNLGRVTANRAPLNLSKDRITIEIGVDNIDVDGVTAFADANALVTALQSIFFLNEPQTPLIPDSQRVDVFADLPDPVANDNKYWIVDNTTSSGVWPFRTINSQGIYKAVSGVWEFKGADVPFYLIDENLQFTDDVTGFGLGFQLDQLTTDRRATWPDKNGVVAYVSDTGVILENITADFQLAAASTYQANRVIRLQNRSGSDWMVSTTGADTIEGESSVIIFDGETFDLTINGTDFRL